MTMADPLYFFGVTVADSEELQDAFRACQSVAEMMQLLRCEGLDLSLQQLRKFACHPGGPGQARARPGTRPSSAPVAVAPWAC